MKLAVIGTGRMGQAVAGRLLANGHQVVIWNRTAGRAPDLVAAGAREAASIADAVQGAEIAITSLANDDAVRQVALGPGGLRPALGAEAVYVDASTVSPALTAELDEAFPRFAAMPILGSPAAVTGGRAIYLVGAEASVASVVDQLFPGLSASALHYPAPPLALAGKVAVNLLLLDGVVALAESIAVGRAGGLSDDQLRALLGASPMMAPGLKNRFEGILAGEQDPWWSAALGAKDAGLAVEVARAAEVRLALTAVARDLYQQVASPSEDDDIAAVARLYRSA